MTISVPRLMLAESPSTDPYRNIAAENLLGRSVSGNGLILYLWQNSDTVVIGRNQNPWAECDCDALEKDGCRIARRLSGGGAVWHDLGNLNYTFIYSDGGYTRSELAKYVSDACRAAGTEAETSGRNDISVGGRKISGTAFYSSRGISYFHGTLLISADTGRMLRYLTPDRKKLDAKGVRSVASRVANMTEYCPGLTVTDMKELLISRVSCLSGSGAEPVLMPEGPELEELAGRLGSWEHNFGSTFRFTSSCSGRFIWGGIQILLVSDRGRIDDVRIYTDSMDPDLSVNTRNALLGKRIERTELYEALIDAAGSDAAGDIADLISGSAV